MRLTMLLLIGLLAGGLAYGCDGKAPSTETIAESTTDGGTTPDTAGTTDTTPIAGGVPTDATALFAWLKDKKYKDYPAETKVHDSDDVHGKGIRVFINTALDASLKAGNKEHPKGSALIKEIYEADKTTLRGWAVMVKTADTGDGGQGWYWYEIFSTTDGGNPVADGNGASKCTGCHSAGTDYVRTVYPLR